MNVTGDEPVVRLECGHYAESGERFRQHGPVYCFHCYRWVERQGPWFGTRAELIARISEQQRSWDDHDDVETCDPGDWKFEHGAYDEPRCDSAAFGYRDSPEAAFYGPTEGRSE